MLLSTDWKSEGLSDSETVKPKAHSGEIHPLSEMKSEDYETTSPSRDREVPLSPKLLEIRRV
jgi:hypothetical protein